jgi:hypothetical protein
MSLRLGLLWLTLNLALIIECSWRNNFFFSFYIPRKTSSRIPHLETTGLDHKTVNTEHLTGNKLGVALLGLLRAVPFLLQSRRFRSAYISTCIRLLFWWQISERKMERWFKYNASRHQQSSWTDRKSTWGCVASLAERGGAISLEPRLILLHQNICDALLTSRTIN